MVHGSEFRVQGFSFRILGLRFWLNHRGRRICTPHSPPACSARGAWSRIEGLGSMVYGVWCVVCGVWCVVCGVWCVVYGVWCVVCGVKGLGLILWV